MIMTEDGKVPKMTPIYLSRSQVPKGAIKLTKDQILEIQQKRLNKTPSSDKLAFRFGPHILGGATAVTACIINAHFRSRFLLFDYGLLFSYVTSVGVPTGMCVIANEYVTRKLLINPECMRCWEIKSGLLQVAVSVLYSSIISPVISIILSREFHTYQTKNNFQPGVKHALKTTRLNRYALLALIAHNFIIGGALRYRQGQELDKIIAKESPVDTRQLFENLID